MQALRVVALLCMLAAACSYDGAEHPQACMQDTDCIRGFYCFDGFCITENATAASCVASAQLEACYSGPDETRDVGACKAGQRLCVEGVFSDCLGQVLPDDEICNGADDDCDQIVDDVPAAATCDTRLRGACSGGQLECREGVDLCVPLHESQTETCNEIDDDCDGTVDEMQASACYPAASGCATNAQGTWQCRGLCAIGFVECDASGAACMGAISPIDEVCSEGDEVAQDEDCDGAIDERCDCEAGAVRTCFAGPVGSDQGRCAAGTQLCDGDGWGACEGQILPRAETCENPGADDDCNGVEDDVTSLGTPCIASAESGECRNGTVECADGAEPECVGSDPRMEQCDELDQDCDDDPTNGYDFATDATCGSCDQSCEGLEHCCDGACVTQDSFDEDLENCGACGVACGEGQYCCQGDCLSVATKDMMACDCSNDCGERACCGMSCRDLRSDENHCGACGLKCGPNKTCDDGVCK